MKSIFVSSTFRDMHFERDVLNRSIAPRINRQLTKYNQSVRILDLRWGVDTSDLSEEEASVRVLSVCMDAIDNCKPYFIVLLGDRYGYIPDGSDISITHMEIIRGAIDNFCKDHVYIYMREADYTGMPDEYRGGYIEENLESASSLCSLKEYLMELMPDRCKRYHSVWSEDEGRLVSEDFESLIIQDLEADIVRDSSLVQYKSDLEKQLTENEQTLRDNLIFAYFDEEQIKAQIDNILSCECPFGIIGDGGTGKSVYMSLLCSALRERGLQADILFCGDNAFSASTRNAAEALLRAMYKACKKDYDFIKFADLSYDDLISIIAEERACVKEKFYFMLDAVEKCDEGMMEFIYWCTTFLSNQVTVIFSSRMTDKIEERKNSLALSKIPYDRDDYRKMAECMLSKGGKSLAPYLIEAILDKTHTALHLQLHIVGMLDLDFDDFSAIQQIGSGMDAINTYLKQVIDDSPEAVDDGIILYLDRLIHESKNPMFHVFMINLLACCEYGVHEDDVRAMYEFGKMNFTELDYLDFLERFAFFVRTRDNGRIDISHDVIRNAILDHTKKHHYVICSLICSYFMERENQDIIAVRTFFEAAYRGGLSNFLVSFFERNRALLIGNDTRSMQLAREIRSCVKRMFFKDNGSMLLSCIKECQTGDEIASLQMAISSSLLSINDFYPDEILEQIAYISIVIPTLTDLFNEDLFEMEMTSCINFLQRHNMDEEKIKEFKEFCINKKYGSKPQDEQADQESNEPYYAKLLDDLRNTNNSTDRTLKLIRLAKDSRRMSANIESADDAVYVLENLLSMILSNEIEIDASMQEMILADIYTSFGSAYKTLKRWEDAIEADEMSLEIYEKLYEKTKTPEIYDKYRSRIYNVANVIEAWAIEEENNTELWERTAESYMKVYELELAALSREMSERGMVQTASAIMSYGKALLRANNPEGIERCKEGAALMHDVAQNNDNPHLYIEFCVDIMDCISSMFLHSYHDAAVELASDIYRYFGLVIESGNEAAIKQLQHFTAAFSNHANDLIAKLHNRGDIYGQNACSEVLYNVYNAILPISPYVIRANMILTKCNICASLFWEMKDYTEAYKQYRAFLDEVVEKGLADPDETGKLIDQANGRLVDAYIRCVICLYYLDRQEELDKLIEEGEKWCRFFADHISFMKGNLPGIYLAIFNSLIDKKIPVATAFLAKAFNAIHEDGYDVEAHSDTVKEIMAYLSEIMGYANPDGGDE